MLSSHVNAFDHMKYRAPVPVDDEMGVSFPNSKWKSTRIAAEVLGSFMEGLGHHVSENYTFTYKNKLELPADVGQIKQPEEDEAEMQAAFREKLVTQIHQLTGKKPRFQLVDEQTNDWVIYEE